MKKLSLLLFCIFEMFFLPVWGEEVDFAEVTQGSETNSGTDSFADSGEVETFFESDFDDSFDDLFSSAEDEVVENQTIPTTQETDATQPAPANMFYVPLKFTGSAKIDVGLGNVWDATGYHFVPGFEFSNTLSFTARISKNLGIQGSFDMSLPKFSFTVSELYFDYLIFDRLYLFGGKRKITWGYPRLFSANILEDAVDNIVLSLDLPVWTGSFSAVFLYPPDKFDSMNVGSMSVVGAAEFVIFDTAIKLFGRKNPSLESYDNPEKYVGHIGGMEIKRSFWGVDSYISISQPRESPPGQVCAQHGPALGVLCGRPEAPACPPGLKQRRLCRPVRELRSRRHMVRLPFYLSEKRGEGDEDFACG